MQLISSCIMRNRHKQPMAPLRPAMLMVALIAVVIAFVTGRQPGKSPELTACSFSETTGRWVQLNGDFYHPGMYTLTTSSDNLLTHAVINMAKPVCPDRVFEALAQKQPLQISGHQLYLNCNTPDSRQVLTISHMAPSQMLTLGIPLDLNRLQADELELLPGIGPRLAERIIRYRQENGDFVSLEALKEVEGIGEKTFTLLTGYFKISK